MPRFNRRRYAAAFASKRRSKSNFDILYCLAPRPPKTGQTVNGDTLREIEAMSSGLPRDGRVMKQKAPRCKPPPAVAFYRDRLTGLTDCGTECGRLLSICMDYSSIWTTRLYGLSVWILFKSCRLLATKGARCTGNLRTVIGLHSRGVRGVTPSQLTAIRVTCYAE